MKFITNEVDFYTKYTTFICENEMINFSRSYFDAGAEKYQNVCINTEKSLAKFFRDFSRF